MSYKHVDRALYLFINELGSATWLSKTHCSSTVAYYYNGDDTTSWFTGSDGTAVAGSITYNRCSIRTESPTTSPATLAPPTTASPTIGLSLFYVLFLRIFDQFTFVFNVLRNV